MADDTKTTDDRDAQIESLQKQLEQLASENAALAQDLGEIRKTARSLEKKLKGAEVSGQKYPDGNFAFFDGQVHPIIGDYRADNTFAEVKRGFCPEGCTLLAIARPH